jgi:hypothetical protein
MLVGIFSGTYSSIFIASPVLTAWKEREPSFARRRERIAEATGTVPAFADEMEMARLGDGEEGDGDVEGPVPQRPAGRAGAVATAEPPPTVDGVPTGDGAAAGNGEPPAALDPQSAAERERAERRRERRRQRRKHGRNR